MFIVGYCYVSLAIHVLMDKRCVNYVVSCEVVKKRGKYNKYVFPIKLFILVGFLGYCINVCQGIYYGLSGPANIFFNLRFANTELHKIYYGSHLLLFLDVAIVLMIILRKYWYFSTRLILFLTIICVSKFIFTMARTSLLLVLLSVSSSYYLSTKYIYHSKVSYKFFIIICILFLLLFFAVAAVTNRARFGYLNALIQYFGYPIISFDDFIIGNPGITRGCIIFAPLYKLISAFFNINILSMNQVINVPADVFNVFSAIQGPYLDYGFYGVLCIFFLI